MKEVLQNLALLDAIKYCRENKINCSGTYIYKLPRKYTYLLVRNDTKAVVCVVRYYKNAASLITNR